MDTRTLYQRLGGYDAITHTVNDLLPRLQSDPLLGRFWAHRGADGIAREKQLLIDFLANAAGGPLYYRGRDMKLAHAGMRLSGEDWRVFMAHLTACLGDLGVPEPERGQVIGFVESLRGEMVELP